MNIQGGFEGGRVLGSRKYGLEDLYFCAGEGCPKKLAIQYFAVASVYAGETVRVE